MKEPSDQATPQELPDCVLPHASVQKLLLELLEQGSFPGSMAEFIVQVKSLVRQATIKSV